MTGKILLVSYTFPPVGGINPFRLLKFAEWLQRESLATVDVLTAEIGPRHPVYWIDHSYAATSHSPVVHRTKEGPGWRLLSLLGPSRDSAETTSSSASVHGPRRWASSFVVNALRALKLVLVPDTRVDWFPSALRRGRSLIRDNHYDLVWSFGFPFTCHLLGTALARRAGVPWLAEYGDPWTFGTDGLPSWRRRLDRRLEGGLLRRASAVVLCTEGARRGLLSTHPGLRRDRLNVVEFGFDSAEYAETLKVGETFLIVYTGIFYPGTRDPSTFFRALADLPGKGLEVVVAGSVAERHTKTANELGLSPRVRFLGAISREETVRLQKGATVLLSFGWGGGFQIPGKLYEYFGARRPILHICGGESDLSVPLIRRFRRGVSVSNSEENIRAELLSLYSAWKNGELDGAFDLSVIEDFSWEAASRKMARVVQTCLAQANKTSIG